MIEHRAEIASPLCAADRRAFRRAGKPRVVRNDIRIMRREESGLEYDAIIRRNPAGDGWDIVKIFDK